MSFYEEMNPADITVEEILPHVRKFLPNIHKKSIHFFYHGTYNVFEIDQKYILRVADREFRNTRGLEMLRREINILNFLQNRFTLSIPEILYLHDSSEIPFSIHQKIPGESLVFVSNQLSSNQKKKIGEEIGGFLSVLHSEDLKNDFLNSFPVQKELMIGNSNFNQSFKLRWIKRYEKAKELWAMRNSQTYHTDGLIYVPMNIKYEDLSGKIFKWKPTDLNSIDFLIETVKDETGEDNRISISANLTMTEIQGAVAESLNAAFSVDGTEYQRQNNSGIDDVIQGVSLTLKKVDTTQLAISSSSETMKEKIINLIDLYNEINTDIDLKTAYATDVNDEGGILSNIQSLKSLDSILFDLLGTVVDTGTDITSLADLGMETNQNGTITLDQSALTEAFASSFDDVVALFIGDSDNGIEGLGDVLNDRLRSMTNSSTGVVTAEKSTAQTKLDTLTESIETATERLDKKYDQMARQFIQLDSFIGRMNSQMDYLSSTLDAFNTSKTD